MLAEEDRARFSLGVEPAAAGDAADRAVLAMAEVLLDDPHVHRLRQIVNRIVSRLGTENLRLVHLGGSCRTGKAELQAATQGDMSKAA